MSSPAWLKSVVLCWITLSFVLLFFAFKSRLTDYLNDIDHKYTDAEWVNTEWSKQLSRLQMAEVSESFSRGVTTPDGIEIWHIFDEGCPCNSLVEKHIADFESLGLKVERVPVYRFDIALPATPTLVIRKNDAIRFFGAYGSGASCLNNGLSGYVASLMVEPPTHSALKSNQLLLNTMLKGCFCKSS